MTDSEKNILFSCGLFKGLSRAECEKLCACINVRVKSCSRGETVWHAGESISSCAVVLSGRASAEVTGYDGKRTVIASNGAGAVVGDVIMSTDNFKSPVRLVMAEAGSLAFLDYGAMIGSCSGACECHTRLRINLLSEISVKFWALRRKIAYLSARSLRKRTAMFLCDEYSRQGRAELFIPMSRDDMADYLGANRSALSRELSRMREDGLVEFRKNRFSLLNISALMQLSEED